MKSLKGLPEFHHLGVQWSRREWASRTGEIKASSWIITTPLAPRASRNLNLYTIPVNKRFFLSDVGGSAGGSLGADWGCFRGFFSYQDDLGYNFWSAYIEPFYENSLHSLITPPALEAGRILQFFSRNEDIVSGHEHGWYIGWETPASEPENPKNDSSDELYRTGTFNHSQIIFLEGNEQIFVFSKKSKGKESIRNYWKVKDYATPNQKTIKQKKLTKPEDIQKINDIMAGKIKTEEIKKVLTKVEK